MEMGSWCARHSLTGWAAWLILALALVASRAGAAELAPIVDSVHWGETSTEIARSFGARAVHLAHPIEFGDSYVDVALRDQTLGGYPFAVYFQMDKTKHGLKRVMLERQRHGANPLVFRAVIAALVRDYGPADKCGSRAPREQVWNRGDTTIRAVFADTTIEAGEGCAPGASACGLTGHLFVQILPRAPGVSCP